MAQGRYASFGYVSTSVTREWSRLRGEGFAKEMERKDRAVEIFQADTGDDQITRRGELAKWLRRLAKPSAVLAADDAVAQEVLQACPNYPKNLFKKHFGMPMREWRMQNRTK